MPAAPLRPPVSNAAQDAILRLPAKPLLDEIKGAFGTAPIANWPAALKHMWSAFGALGAGTIGANLGEKIAVAVANRDSCSYCLAAHTVLGKKAGATGDEMLDAQAGLASEQKRLRRSASR